MSKLRMCSVLLSLIIAATVHGEPKKSRVVTCPAQCDKDEDSDETQKCVQRSKEQYKIDGIGCVKWEKVCWCAPKRQPLPPMTVL